ncbi:MAG: gliding motility-associated C-terminal domain-containing protein, partial [Bacteroidota bacterium]
FGDGSPRVPYDLGADLSHTYQDTGQYVISLQIENEGNCVSEFELPICVKREQRLFAPNVFSPNFDGFNDVFQLKGVGITDINWQIYNRWGQIIYEGNSMEDSWDGKQNGRRVPPGVYTFMVRYRTDDQKSEILKGAVAVVY